MTPRTATALVRAGLLAVALAMPFAAPARAQFRENVIWTVRDLEASRAGVTVVHSLAANPGIVVFDFPTLSEQGRMFNRIVALVERANASREEVLNDRQLAELIRSLGRKPTTFAFGNDFRVSELTNFFNRASDAGIALNAEEVALRDFLLERRFMAARYGFYQIVPPDRVVLSVPAEQGRDSADGVPISASVRRTIIRHELGHAEFYSNPRYAEYCAAFWRRTLTEAQRQAFRGFLAAHNYDTRNEDLMINEAQAYLLHTPDPAVFSAEKVRMTPDAVDRLRRSFWAGNPPTTLFAGSGQQVPN